MNNQKLSVSIISFSFKNPPVWSECPNGGGFVFDCRSLPNPGREERYKYLTGLDKEVHSYLLETVEFNKFFESSFELVSQTVENYLTRGFTQLIVGYGCTGGQHRSVLCALLLSNRLMSNINEKMAGFPISDQLQIFLTHREANNWPSVS